MYRILMLGLLMPLTTGCFMGKDAADRQHSGGGSQIFADASGYDKDDVSSESFKLVLVCESEGKEISVTADKLPDATGKVAFKADQVKNGDVCSIEGKMKLKETEDYTFFYQGERVKDGYTLLYITDKKEVPVSRKLSFTNHKLYRKNITDMTVQLQATFPILKQGETFTSTYASMMANLICFDKSQEQKLLTSDGLAGTNVANGVAVFNFKLYSKDVEGLTCNNVSVSTYKKDAEPAVAFLGKIQSPNALSDKMTLATKLEYASASGNLDIDLLRAGFDCSNMNLKGECLQITMRSPSMVGVIVAETTEGETVYITTKSSYTLPKVINANGDQNDPNLEAYKTFDSSLLAQKDKAGLVTTILDPAPAISKFTGIHYMSEGKQTNFSADDETFINWVALIRYSDDKQLLVSTLEAGSKAKDVRSIFSVASPFIDFNDMEVRVPNDSDRRGEHFSEATIPAACSPSASQILYSVIESLGFGSCPMDSNLVVQSQYNDFVNPERDEATVQSVDYYVLTPRSETL